MSQDKAPPAPSPTHRDQAVPATPHRASLYRAADRAKVAEETYSHPFNPNSKIFGRTLSDETGLERIGIHWVRVPAGKESFVYHRHRTEEEFVYILSGRGIAEIDGEEHEVGPGDFMGFGTSPPVAHHLRNPFPEDLVYLSGGERRQSEIAEFPQLGKMMVRVGANISIFETTAAQAMGHFKKVQ
jgi:uncharacterized cupin superfamily protein